MAPIEPKVDDAGRYSINETCEVLGIHRNTLMNHTRQGHIRCGYRKVNMRKLLTQSLEQK